MSTNITVAEVTELAATWYKKLDVHAPMVEVLPLLATDAEMVFPEASLKGLAGFESWYQRVIRIFFDEVHTLKVVTINGGEEAVEVHVVVEWQASVWNPPADKSARIVLDADQTWVVKRSAATQRLVITKYVVNSLDYKEGSARL